MKTLLQNAKVVNVFTGELEEKDVLIEDDRIIGVDNYTEADADICVELDGKYICPGFIDGHIHIESTMLTPTEFAKVCAPHGTTSVMADPHEIANVCGEKGIDYMLKTSEELPVTVYIMLPSCVPATGFDETGAVLNAENLDKFYSHPRVLGLGEVMNYPGVLSEDAQVMRKISSAKNQGGVINGHAPMLTGRALDKYISAGINDEHECNCAQEAFERVRKGQWVMVRHGTAARNLEALLPLLDEPWAHRCLLVTDDKHPDELLFEGHIDSIIRMAVRAGKNPISTIRMATLQAAQCFGLKWVGAVAPGYVADLLVLDDLNEVKVRDVYFHGKKTVENGKLLDFAPAKADSGLERSVHETIKLKTLTEEDFMTRERGKKSCRIILLQSGSLITGEAISELDLSEGRGADTARDIIKLAVIERHHNTGHIGLGFVSGLGLKRGAIASSVSHDSHNIIVIGENERDMAFAANSIKEMGGGCVVVLNEKIVAKLALPVAGLMSDENAELVIKHYDEVQKSTAVLGVSPDCKPFMPMSFMALSVIPHLKMTSLGLVNVDRQEVTPLVVE